MLRERGRFSPARYFVEEVISGFDETDLYKTWVRTAAMRSPQERNTRLENMSWRIWNLARKKKQIEGEEASRLSKQHLERQKARRYAAADMSEDLSEGEKVENINESSQALRYLYVRWGVELSNMTVVVGESGDTDYDGLLGGVHKTIVLKGSFNASPNQVHAARSYSLQDVVSFDKPGFASVEGYGPDKLKSALQQFGVLKD